MTTPVDHVVTAVSGLRNNLGPTLPLDRPGLVWAGDALRTGAHTARIPHHHRFAS